MRQDSFTTRDWIYIALFGGLWGAVEMSLGSYLHALFPPLANSSLTGIILTGIGVVVVLTGRRFVPKRGAILGIGFVAATLKALSVGGIIIGPLLAILAEAVLMEAVLLPGREPNRARYSIAGAAAVGWGLVHPIIAMRLLYGQGAEQVLLKMVNEGSQLLGTNAGYAGLIVGLMFLLRIAVGAFAGWVAWDLARAVGLRLARE